MKRHAAPYAPSALASDALAAPVALARHLTRFTCLVQLDVGVSGVEEAEEANRCCAGGADDCRDRPHLLAGPQFPADDVNPECIVGLSIGGGRGRSLTCLRTVSMASRWGKLYFPPP